MLVFLIFFSSARDADGGADRAAEIDRVFVTFGDAGRLEGGGGVFPRTFLGPAAEGVVAARLRQWHSHTLRPRGVPSASHQASHRHSGTSDRKQSASQGSTVPSGHSSGGHAHEGECWARRNGTSGQANPLSATGAHCTRGKDHAVSATSSDVAMTSSGQGPSMMMVTIIRCRIVFSLRFQADAVVRYAKGTDQHLESTVVSKSDEAPSDLRQIDEVVAASAPATRHRAMVSWPSLSVSCMFSA
jgi:hypothetical protein